MKGKAHMEGSKSEIIGKGCSWIPSWSREWPYSVSYLHYRPKENVYHTRSTLPNTLDGSTPRDSVTYWSNIKIYPSWTYTGWQLWWPRWLTKPSLYFYRTYLTQICPQSHICRKRWDPRLPRSFQYLIQNRLCCEAIDRYYLTFRNREKF